MMETKLSAVARLAQVFAVAFFMRILPKRPYESGLAGKIRRRAIAFP